jgi:CubicO group peptidase (beta-lactamase class C family)
MKRASRSRISSRTVPTLSIRSDDYERLTRDEFVAKAVASRLRYVPARSYHYSNVGYSLLGAITELVTGRIKIRYLYDTLFNQVGC